MTYTSDTHLRQAAIAAAQASVQSAEGCDSHETGAQLHEAASAAHRTAGDTEAADAHHRAAIAQWFMVYFPTEEANDIAYNASIDAHIASDVANGLATEVLRTADAVLT